MVTQSKLGDYPSEKAKRSPGGTVIRHPQKKEIKQVTTYTPKHREIPGVTVISQEEAEKAKETKRREIEYQRMRMER